MMKVFISSVIIGFEAYRDAAASAVKSLGHEVIRAEEFPAFDTSSRVACLVGVREADIVILLLGKRYGSLLPPRNLSPTHEEFLEAKDSKPIFVFLEENQDFEAAQIKFLSEVEAWDNGRHRRTFSNPAILRDEITRAVHQYLLRSERAQFDYQSLINVVDSQFSEVRNKNGNNGAPFVS